MKHLGDITKINGAEIEPVDCITFGAPCQDLSVAGKRAGMKHEAIGDEETTRSGLFYEAIRIIKEMREEDERSGRTNEFIRPRWGIYENVPGATSSNKGEDFRCVLEAFAQIIQEDAVIPRPANGKWSQSGLILLDRGSIAWRVHDAQFWGATQYFDGRMWLRGTPQRRKRIAVVADFSGHSAGEVLFERKSLPWDSDESEEAGQGTSEAVRGCSAKTGGTVTKEEQPILLESSQNHATVQNSGICTTLPASMGTGGGYVSMVTEDKVHILNPSDSQGNQVADGSGVYPTLRGCGGAGYQQGYCLTEDKPSATAKEAYGVDTYNQAAEEEVSMPLRAHEGGDTTAKVLEMTYGFEPGAAQRLNPESRFSKEVAPTLRQNMGDNQTSVAYTLKIRGGVERDSQGRKAGKGALIQTEKSATLGVSQDQTLIRISENEER